LRSIAQVPFLTDCSFIDARETARLKDASPLNHHHLDMLGTSSEDNVGYDTFFCETEWMLKI
jgi:hypothetical protein